MSNTEAKDQKKRQFILSGHMFKVVVLISLPLVLLNLFNYLYGIVDTFVVAGIDKDGSLTTSVVIIDQLKNLFTAIGTGVATGCSIVVSRLIGKNDFAKAKTVANTILIVTTCIAVGLIVILLPLARPILRLSKLTPEQIDASIGYFLVQIVSIGVNIFNAVFFGLEKSRGATQNILYINLAVMTVKISLTLLFVYVFSFGTTMVAAATLIANSVITIYAIVMLFRSGYLFRFSAKDTMFRAELFKPFLSLSLPVFLGRFSFSMGKVIVSTKASHYGTEAAGALGVSNHISGSVTNVTNSIEESSSMIISQNLGNKNTKRVYSCFWWSMLLAVCIGVLGVTLLSVFQEQIVHLFSKGKDNAEEYAALVSKIFDYEKVGIIALAISAPIMGLVYGLGYTKLALLTNLSRLFVFRIPTIYIMIYAFPEMGAEALGIAMMVSNVGIGLMSIVIGIVCLRKVRQNKIKDKVKI